MEIEYKVFEAEVKEFDEKDLTVVHFISTERLDRGKDILYATSNEGGKGMVMQGRPVVLFMHGWGSSGMEPIAKPVWIKPGEFKKNKGIQAKTQFFPDDLGQRLWKKTTEGYMPNWSVGWRPLKHEMKSLKDGTEIRHVYEWELLEYSIVGVPMQPDAQTLSGDGQVTDKAVGQISFKVFAEERDHCDLCGEKKSEVQGIEGTTVLFCASCIREMEDEAKRFGELVGLRKTVNDRWEEKPYPNEHACRLENPDKYIRIRRENDKFGKGIHAIWGVQGGGKPVELQAIRFAKDKFTAAEARKWLKDNKYKCTMFEPATGKCEKCQSETAWKWFLNDAPEKLYDGPTLDSIKFTEAELSGRYVCEKCHDGKKEEASECACEGAADDKGTCTVCNKPKPKQAEKEEPKEEEVVFVKMEDFKAFEERIVGLIETVNEAVKDLTTRLKALPVKPGGQETDKEEGDHAPEKRTVVVINSEEEAKALRKEVLKQVGSQILETVQRVVPATVKEELGKMKGRVE